MQHFHRNEIFCRLLMVGNFLTGNKGKLHRSRGVGEELANYFIDCGIQVRVTSKRQNGFLRLLDMLWTIWRFQYTYDLAQVDVFSGRAFYWALFSCQILSFLNKPFVLSLHGGALPEFAAKHPLMVKKLLLTANVLTTPSPYLLNAMSGFRKDIRLVPNPINLSNYPFVLRQQTQPHLVWLRAFHRLYNPLLAVKVLQKLLGKFSNARLLMVGPDKGDGSLQVVQKYLNQEGLEQAVQIIPGVAKEDVPVWLQKGDIFLNTSNVDNTPVSVIEAMACGLPVVSTNVGGIPDLLQHNSDALLVPPNDVDAMVEAVIKLIDHPEIACRFSRSGRERSAKFDSEKVVPRWHAIFKEIAASHADIA